jgi:hypothetical protein
MLGGRKVNDPCEPKGTDNRQQHCGHPRVVYKTHRGLAEVHYAVASSSWQQTEVLSLYTLQIATRMKGTS